MTIEWRKGDLFLSGADALVNPVNCVGVMGAGLALEFKKRFPQNFLAYKKACETHYAAAFGGVAIGSMFVWWNENGKIPKWIINFPTKRHWRDKSSLLDIDLGLIALVETLKMLGPKSVAIPSLGCGLGGLAWTDVAPKIEAAVTPLANDLHIYIYAPQ